MRNDQFARKCLMTDTGVLLKNAEIGIAVEFHSNGTHFNQLLYHCTANYCDKQS